MKIDLTSTIYLIAAAQALLMMFVIARKGKIRHSEKYLLGILLALTITLLHYVSIINQLHSYQSIFASVSPIAWLTISPLMFLYCRAIVGQEQEWRWRNLLYFPFSLYFLAQMFLVSAGIYIGFYLLFSEVNAYNVSWLIGYLSNSLFFSIWSIRTLQNARLPDKQKAEIRWLRQYFQVFSLFLATLLVLLFWCFNANYFITQLEYCLLIMYVVFIFSLVFKSIRFSSYFNILSNDQYGHDQQDDGELATLYNKLEHYMVTDRPFLQPKLSLADLAQALEVPENRLSQLFTRYLDSNYYNYINRYRLEEFERQLNRETAQQYTIMALAEAAGFASKATFYKVFKEQYQMTPSEFIKRKARKKGSGLS